LVDFYQQRSGAGVYRRVEGVGSVDAIGRAVLDHCS